VKPKGRESFGKQISKLLISRNVGNVEVALLLMLANNMIRDIDVLGLLVLFGVVDQAYGKLIVRVQDNRVSLRKTKGVE
jgi:hypothetical protein